MSIEYSIVEDTRERIVTPTAGAVSIAVPFYFQKNADLLVSRETHLGEEDWVDLVEGSGYALTGAGVESGGTVTLALPADGAHRYRVRGAAGVDRLTSVVQGGAVKGALLDKELDRTRIIQMEQKRLVTDYAALGAALRTAIGDEAAMRLAADFALALMIEQGGSFQDLVDAGGVLPRNGSAPMIGNLPFGGFKGTHAADGTEATDVATLGQMVAAFGQIETYYEPDKTTFIPKEIVYSRGSVGSSLTYGEWWITTQTVRRWYKPAFPFLHSVIFTAVSGAGGGGTSAGADGTPSTGAGGKGGGLSRKTVAAADLPSVLVFVLGHGGMAGGWNVTPVLTPGPPDFVANQGCIFEDGTGNFDGGWGGHTAILTEAAWNALGANDAARLVAFNALSETDAAALCAPFPFCSGGQGGTAAWTNNYAGSSLGGRAYNGDLNFDGSGGGGGGPKTTYTDFKAWFVAMSADPDQTLVWAPSGGYGSGGAAAAYGLNDGLWPNFPHPISGILGRFAGAGASWKADPGNHDGSHGALWGGAGGGGQADSPQNYLGQARVMPGGFGAWGGIHAQPQFAL